MAEDVYGDPWKVRRARDWLIIPCAIGWKQGEKGREAVLERGLFAETARRLPEFTKWWGDLCAAGKGGTQVAAHARWKVITFPTRPLAGNPALSWKGETNVQRIQRSCDELVALEPLLPPGGRLLLPFAEVAGTLDPERVEPLLRTLTVLCPRVVLVQTGKGRSQRPDGLPAWVDDEPDPPLDQTPEEVEPLILVALTDEDEREVPGEEDAREDSLDPLTTLIDNEGDAEGPDTGGWDTVGWD